MTFDVTPYVEIATDGWQDVTEHVFTATGHESIHIEHANQGMNQGLGEPSSCQLTFQHPDMWPDNPNSPHYGLLGLNTRMRIADLIFAHTFPGTVVDSWSDVGGLPVTNTGSGGSVLASDWQQTPGVGTHSIPVANAYRQTVLAGYAQEDGEQAISFRLPTSDVTGAGIEPANLIHQWQSGSGEHVMLRVVVNTDETISLRFFLMPGDLALGGVFTCSNVTNTGQWIRVKTNVEARRLQAKAWSEDTDDEPVAWTVDVSTVTGTLARSRRGGIGVRTGVATGNTNTKPIVVEYRRWTTRAILFYGGISEFPLEPVEGSDGEIEIPIIANGLSRQYAQGQLPAVSVLARTIPTHAGLVAYWPMEDEADSGSVASGLPGHPPMEILHGSPGFAEYSDLDCSAPLPTGNLADWAGPVPPYTDTGIIQAIFILRCPSSPLADRSILLRFYTDHPSARMWQLVYRTSSGGSLEIQAANAETDTVYVSGTGIDALDNVPRRISFELQNNGANVDWDLVEYPFDVTIPGSTDSGTATGFQLSTVKRVWVNTSLRDDVVYGHLEILNQIIDLAELSVTESLAFVGDHERDRLERVYADNGITFTSEDVPASLFHHYRMGPQRAVNMTTLLEEAVDLNSGGTLYDGRTHDGIMWRDRFVICEDATPHLELTYAQLAPPFTGRRDDRDIRNRITVKRDGGSSGTYELESGPKSTLQPSAGGVGLYPSSITVNKETDQELQQIAAWRVAIGTVNEPRYSVATIELAAVDATPTIRARLRDLRPGHYVTISSAQRIYAFDPIHQQVAGYSIDLTQFRLAYQLNMVPRLPFRVFEIEDTDRGRLDSRSTTLAAAINTVAASFQVTSPSAVWVTDPAMFPFKVTMDGERLVVTDINGTVPAYISTGTASHADNASCTPGLPAGAVAGNDMVMFTRNRAGNPANLPTGWSDLFATGSLKMFRKTHAGGSESAPTVTWPAGAAGDTNSAVIAAFSNLGSLIASVGQVNASAQNIATPSLSGQIPDGIALIIGSKSDDWTGVATLPIVGGTEIVDTSTTVGNDQGLVVDYKTHNGSVTGNPVLDVPADVFVVTGGASAGGRSAVLIFGNKQTFEVTRSDNTVVKSHSTGAKIHLYNPPRFAL